MAYEIYLTVCQHVWNVKCSENVKFKKNLHDNRETIRWGRSCDIENSGTVIKWSNCGLSSFCQSINTNTKAWFCGGIRGIHCIFKTKLFIFICQLNCRLPHGQSGTFVSDQVCRWHREYLSQSIITAVLCIFIPKPLGQCTVSWMNPYRNTDFQLSLFSLSLSQSPDKHLILSMTQVPLQGRFILLYNTAHCCVCVCVCVSRHKSTQVLFEEIARAVPLRTIPLMFPLEKQSTGERGKAKRVS